MTIGTLVEPSVFESKTEATEAHLEDERVSAFVIFTSPSTLSHEARVRVEELRQAGRTPLRVAPQPIQGR